MEYFVWEWLTCFISIKNKLVRKKKFTYNSHPSTNQPTNQPFNQLLYPHNTYSSILHPSYLTHATYFFSSFSFLLIPSPSIHPLQSFTHILFSPLLNNKSPSSSKKQNSHRQEFSNVVEKIQYWSLWTSEYVFFILLCIVRMKYLYVINLIWLC